jgi:anti-sigma regulatory factor (Ser/Thr protein kinase)
VEYACAGHPYPLLVGADGTVQYLQDGRRPPLAAYSAGPASPAGRTELPPGALLVLYTDGLFERRGESLDVGLERLAHAAAECALMPAGDVCSELLARMIPDTGYLDDVAIVAVRPAGRTARAFVESIPAQIEELAPLRAHFRDWLRSRHMMSSPKAEHNVVLAVGEALNNAIEHGSGFDPRRIVSLEAFAVAGGISATVSDTGRWKTDSAASRPGSARGHGLTIVHGLSDDVKTVRSILGTRVTMRFVTDG